MKTIFLILMAISLSGCSMCTVDKTELQKSVQFCADKGGVETINTHKTLSLDNVIFPTICICSDGTSVSLAEVELIN